MSHLKRLYGRSAMAEIVQNVIGEVARDTLAERGERAATPARLQALPGGRGAAEKILTEDADLTYTMTYEVLPKVDLGNFTLDRDRAAGCRRCPDAEVDEEVTKLAESARTFSPKTWRRRGRRPADDRLCRRGRRRAIPGGGPTRTASCALGASSSSPASPAARSRSRSRRREDDHGDLPEDYGRRHLAGKEATFDVTVKEVAAPDPITDVDDELAKRRRA